MNRILVLLLALIFMNVRWLNLIIFHPQAEHFLTACQT